MNANTNTNNDNLRLTKYNEHITKLESLFKSVYIRGEYPSYKLAPCFMLFSFIDLLRGVTLLDFNHLFSSGNIIVRTMYEILVDYLYCETNRKFLYLRFAEFQNVSRVQLYNSSPKEVQKNIDVFTFRNYTLPEYNRFIKKYKIKNNKQLNNWSGISFKSRVDIVGKNIPKILDLYTVIYKINCNYTHTQADTISEYSYFFNGEVHMNYEQKYCKDNLLLLKQVNSLVDIFYEHFNKNYANKNLSEISFKVQKLH